MRTAATLAWLASAMFAVWRLPAAAAPHDTTVLLRFSDGGECSGTVVGKHTILTATHCITGTTARLDVSGQPAVRRSILSDGADHSLLVVDKRFDTYAPVSTNGLRQGDRVHYWGNPMYFHDLYREGYVGGSCDAPKECLRDVKVTGVTFEGPIWELMVPGGPGDSGAGVFNESGEVVGVVSAITQVTPAFKMMMAVPFRFPSTTWSDLR